jgi:hypothetical protein
MRLMLRRGYWLGKVIICLTILLISLSPILGAQADEQYKQMDGEAKFSKIQKQVTHSALSISNYKASDAYREINSALSDSQRLHTLVQKADYVNEVIDEVTDGLDRISTAYDRVIEIGSDMKRYRGDEFLSLRGFNRETLKTQQDLEKRVKKLNAESNSLQKRLRNVTDEFELKEINLTLQGNNSIVSSLEAQHVIWDKFYSSQNKLLESLDLNGRKVDLLLQALEVNSNVYHEAATVAHLRQSAQGALESLGNLADIQNIIGDLQDSFLQVNDIVSEISEADFASGIQ